MPPKSQVGYIIAPQVGLRSDLPITRSWPFIQVGVEEESHDEKLAQLRKLFPASPNRERRPSHFHQPLFIYKSAYTYPGGWPDELECKSAAWQLACGAGSRSTTWNASYSEKFSSFVVETAGVYCLIPEEAFLTWVKLESATPGFLHNFLCGFNPEDDDRPTATYSFEETKKPNKVFDLSDLGL